MEREWHAACAAERMAVARQERAAREVEQLKSEISQLKREASETQRHTARMLSEAEAMKQVVRSLEVAKETTARVRTDLLTAVATNQRQIQQLEKDKHELEVFLTEKVSAKLMSEIKFKTQILCEEVKEKAQRKEEQQREAARCKAEQERRTTADNWSSKVTVGDESGSRLADADDELRLQQAEAELGMNWSIANDICPSLD